MGFLRLRRPWGFSHEALRFRHWRASVAMATGLSGRINREQPSEWLQRREGSPEPSGNPEQGEAGFCPRKEGLLTPADIMGEKA